jgi:hypothetical protein
MGTDLFELLAYFGDHGQMANTAEYAARTERVADALLNAVFYRDLDIHFVSIQPAYLYGNDYIIRVLKRLQPVGCRSYGALRVLLGNHLLG